MLSLGEQDGKASVEAGPQTVSDTFHYFALKKSGDQRVNGVGFDQFVTMRANGIFEDYNILEDPQMQAMFLQ